MHVRPEALAAVPARRAGPAGMQQQGLVSERNAALPRAAEPVAEDALAGHAVALAGRLAGRCMHACMQCTVSP